MQHYLTKMSAGDEEKKKGSRKRYEIPKTASCHVCGDQAAEHLHYGGIACYSCRAFFRRTVNSTRPILGCSNSNNCVINKETRKRCQSCRYDKCKEIGMKPSWVLSEEEKGKIGGAQKKNNSPGSPEQILVKKEKIDPVVQMLEEQSNNPESSSFPLLEEGSPNEDLKKTSFSTGMGDMSRMKEENGSKCASPPGGEDRKSELKSLYKPEENAPSTIPSSCAQQFTPTPTFPFNKMQVSLSAPGSDGLSVTIEAHQTKGKRQEMCAKQEENQNKPQQNSFVRGFYNEYPKYNFFQDNADASYGMNYRNRYCGGRGFEPHLPHPPGYPLQQPPMMGAADNRGYMGDSPSFYNMHKRVKTEETHAQQSRTIFLHRGGLRNSETKEPRYSTTNQTPSFIDQSENGQVTTLKDELENSISMWNKRQGDGLESAQLWTLDSVPLNDSLNNLQETLFLEQLASIDERIRLQVPMEVEHVRSFLDCALTGKKISQNAVMHAYKICIKRIVRFSNSLQDFVQLPPDDMRRLLVTNTVNMITVRLVRWFHPETNLEKQLALCSTGTDLYKEVTIQQDLDPGYVERPVHPDDVFVSPWCCDSHYEDRFSQIFGKMLQLPLDTTCMVLLSVLTLFDSGNVEGLRKFDVIVSHEKKFSLLLYRYLKSKYTLELADEYLQNFMDAVVNLRELADILVNKRLIC